MDAVELPLQNTLIAVAPRQEQPEASRITREAQRYLHIDLQKISIWTVFQIQCSLPPEELLELARTVLSDSILQDVSFLENIHDACDWVIETALLPGVTDTESSTALHALIERRPNETFRIKTIRHYRVYGSTLSENDLHTLAEQQLANPLIQSVSIWQPQEGCRHEQVATISDTRSRATTVEHIELKNDEEHLAAVSSQRQLALSVEEMKAIYDYYQRPTTKETRRRFGLDDHPTDVELEALAQTWSEHCKHKIFRATIHYSAEGESSVIESLFDRYIRRCTDHLAKDRPWLVSVFSDNAGIVELCKGWHLACKVETHNSPSALDPYGGALTGILGVNRDIMGAGMGARLMANSDVFCLAPPDYQGELPPKLQHPRRVLEGVRRGVEHGGNKMGVPTVNGSLVFDPSFLGKPLVYCGSVGILPEKVCGECSARKNIAPNDLAIVVGGRTGRDGIHGATFSSEALHEGSSTSAVQIGDPFTQKKMADFLLEARDKGLYRCITDNGAGGLSSSIGELAQLSSGCQISLDRVPLKAEGLQPWEILLSESQERMTLAVSPSHLDALKQLAQHHEVEIAVVGRFTNSGYFHVILGEETVAILDLAFLHEGVPTMQLEASWTAPQECVVDATEAECDYGEVLLSLLGRYTICSKESIIRQYDHEVQGSTIGKPLVGINCDGPADAAVLWPLELQEEGVRSAVVYSHGICPRYSCVDCYHMAAYAVDEALRNAVAVGAVPDSVAILDNFCWPDPTSDPQKAGQLVRACQGLYDAAMGFTLPIISGKDSMKNDYRMGGVTISVLPTLLITAIGRLTQLEHCTTMDVKRPGDLLYLVGETRNELAGSEYYALLDKKGGRLPRVAFEQARDIYRAVHTAIAEGVVSSCHDCSEGGLAVAVAESAFSGDLGVELDLRRIPTNNSLSSEALLFSESASRFVITIRPEHEERLAHLLTDLPHSQVGVVTENRTLRVTDGGDSELFALPIDDLREAWQTPLGGTP